MAPMLAWAAWVGALGRRCDEGMAPGGKGARDDEDDVDWNEGLVR